MTKPYDHYAATYFPDCFDEAVRADLWEVEGKEWNPHAQCITNVKDDFHYPQVKECIRRHAGGVVAYFVTPTLTPETLSIELQFHNEAEGEAFLRDYNNVRLHKPKPKNKGKLKKLLNNRMYILPDGTEFWLYDKWDNSRRIGKVLGKQPNTVENHIVDEHVLRTCEIVPKGQEKWHVGS